jgi:hypothetical protein
MLFISYLVKAKVKSFLLLSWCSFFFLVHFLLMNEMPLLGGVVKANAYREMFVEGPVKWNENHHQAYTDF